MTNLARAAMPADLPAPQMVQPFWFGEPAYKKTGWYLRGLPRLIETNRLPEPERGSDDWKAWNFIHRMPPGPDRARLRSRSFPGMMAAAAAQWAGHATHTQEQTMDNLKAPRFPEGLMLANRGFVNINRS